MLWWDWDFPRARWAALSLWLSLPVLFVGALFLSIVGALILASEATRLFWRRRSGARLKRLGSLPWKTLS